MTTVKCSARASRVECGHSRCNRCHILTTNILVLAKPSYLLKVHQTTPNQAQQYTKSRKLTRRKTRQRVQSHDPFFLFPKQQTAGPQSCRSATPRPAHRTSTRLCTSRPPSTSLPHPANIHLLRPASFASSKKRTQSKAAGETKENNSRPCRLQTCGSSSSDNHMRMPCSQLTDAAHCTHTLQTFEFVWKKKCLGPAGPPGDMHRRAGNSGPFTPHTIAKEIKRTGKANDRWKKKNNKLSERKALRKKKTRKKLTISKRLYRAYGYSTPRIGTATPLLIIITPAWVYLSNYQSTSCQPHGCIAFPYSFPRSPSFLSYLELASSSRQARVARFQMLIIICPSPVLARLPPKPRRR